MRATYSKRTCWKCKRQISAAGCAWDSHMMAHVRRGEAELIKRSRFTTDFRRTLNKEYRWTENNTKVKA